MPKTKAALQFTIRGSKHSLELHDDGDLTVGCHTHPLSWWKTHYQALGRAERYESKEIEEYGGYLTKIDAIIKVWNQPQAKTKKVDEPRTTKMKKKTSAKKLKSDSSDDETST